MNEMASGNVPQLKAEIKKLKHIIQSMACSNDCATSSLSPASLSHFATLDNAALTVDASTAQERVTRMNTRIYELECLLKGVRY